MSTFFPNSRNFSINGGHFSHVGGDQHNHYNHASTSSAGGQMLITQGESSTMMTVHVSGDQINQIVQQKEKERTAFDDFRNVRQGDFCRLKDIGINWYRRDCPFDRTICLAEVDGSPGKVYTAVSYSGPDARKAFEADFQTYSQVLSSQVVQIYAIDIGTVPSLLLRNELVPLAHFEKHVSWSVELHLCTLLWQWRCRGEEVWIDSARGIICRGPAGPDSNIRGWEWKELRDAPSTVDFFQEDVVLRFFSSQKSREVDRMLIVWMAAKNSYLDYVPELVNPNTAEVISTLSNTPIAIAARHDQTWNSLDNLLEETLVENGLFRFRLGNGRCFSMDWGLCAREAWLSQAWSVFHALGINVEDDLEAFGAIMFPCPLLSFPPAYMPFPTAQCSPNLMPICPAPPLNRKQNGNDDFNSQYTFLFDHFLLPSHPMISAGSNTKPLHCTIGLFEKMATPPSHMRLVTTLGFQLRSVSTVISPHILGLPTCTKPSMNINCSKASTRGLQISLDTLDMMTPSFSPWMIRLDSRSYVKRITGFPESHVDSDPEDVYDESDDYSLTALFYTGSDNDTYTNSSHISTIQERKDPHDDSLSSSGARAKADVAIPMEGILANTDHDINEQQKTGAGTGLEDIEGRGYLNQAPEFTAPLNEENPSLPTISDVDLSSDNTSLNIVLPTPAFPTQLTGLLTTSHSGTHEDDGVHPTSTHTDANISSIGSDTIISNTNTPKNAGVSATSHSTNNNNRACNALAGASNISSAVSYPLDSIIHTPVYSTSTVEYSVTSDALLTRHHDGGPPASVAQQHWIPRPFVSNIRPIAHRSSWPVLATSRTPTRIEDNRCNGDGNEELD
ncbi:hypothetical protein PQX77_019338 [Marasmius sp. AFHP31]|nr:hypothetical protein PQX77_019338 [Marasmius sp. AFHP31]